MEGLRAEQTIDREGGTMCGGDEEAGWWSWETGCQVSKAGGGKGELAS